MAAAPTPARTPTRRFTPRPKRTPTPTQTFTPRPTRTATPTWTLPAWRLATPTRTRTPRPTWNPTPASRCSPEAIRRIKETVKPLFEEYEFAAAEKSLRSVRPACGGDPLVRLYRLLAEAGRISLEQGSIPQQESRSLSRRIAEILRQRPDLARQGELPFPFSEQGNPIAEPYERAVRSLRGGSP